MKINLHFPNFCFTVRYSKNQYLTRDFLNTKIVQLFFVVIFICGVNANAQAVIIASSVTNNIICAGNSVTFTATPIDEGASTSYQWYVGDLPVGENNLIFTTSTLVDGDEVSVVMTSDGVDYSSENRILITINDLPNAGTDGTMMVCSGTIPSESELFEHLGGTPDEGGVWTNEGLVYTYTVRSNSPCNDVASAKVKVIEKAINSGVVSVANNGSSSLAGVKVCSGNNNVVLTLSDSYGNIQWLYSNTPTGAYRSIPEENNTTLVLSNLIESGTLYYYAKVSCSTTVFTNKIAVTVQKSIPGTITGSGTICSGNTKTLTLVGSSETIQWQSSVTGIIGSYKNIEGVSGASYTTPALTENTYYQAIVQTGDCMPVVTQPVLVGVNKSLGSWTIQEGDSSVCYGKQAVLHLINNEKTLANSIAWYKSTNAGLSWTVVSGQISATLSSGNLTVSTWFKAKVVNGTCSVETPMVKVVVAPTAKSGIIVADKISVCQNGIITFSLSGSVGSVYDWQTSPTGLTGTFSSVGSGATYTTSPTSLATLNVKCIISNPGCSTAMTSTKKVIVDKAAVAGTIKGGGAVCSSSVSTMQLTGYIGKIQWEFSTDGVNFAAAPYLSSGIYNNPNKASTFTTTASTNNTSTYILTNIKDNTYFRAKVSNGSCSAVYTETVLYKNAIVATAGILSTQASSVLSGSSTTLQLANYVGQIVWQKSTNYLSTPLMSTWSTVPGTASIISTGSLTSATAYRAMVTIGACSTEYSNISLVGINKIEMPSITVNTISPTTSSVVTRMVNLDSIKEKQDIAEPLLSVIAYPNPSSSVFNLEFSSSVSGKLNRIQVYNMTGQLIEQRQVQQSENVELGSEYARGIYNVIVTQGEQVKTLKLVKE
jgi:hypothetical protein